MFIYVYPTNFAHFPTNNLLLNCEYRHYVIIWDGYFLIIENRLIFNLFSLSFFRLLVSVLCYRQVNVWQVIVTRWEVIGRG